jgi:hypothetical protein
MPTIVHSPALPLDPGGVAGRSGILERTLRCRFLFSAQEKTEDQALLRLAVVAILLSVGLAARGETRLERGASGAGIGAAAGAAASGVPGGNIPGGALLGGAAGGAAGA